MLVKCAILECLDWKHCTTYRHVEPDINKHNNKIIKYKDQTHDKSYKDK